MSSAIERNGADSRRRAKRRAHARVIRANRLLDEAIEPAPARPPKG
jgi:hypothetical protein